MFQLSEEHLLEMRQQLFKFARLQLKDPDLAEDVVQDTLSKAFQYAEHFQNRAALKTWIFAILKNKIINYLRQRTRMVTVSELEDTEGSIELFFDQQGHWREPVNEWHNVEQSTYQKEFWAIFDLCLNKLPATQARVFMMKSYLELPSEQICLECEVSVSNLNVLLHRARLQLQACLSRNWFHEEK